MHHIWNVSDRIKHYETIGISLEIYDGVILKLNKVLSYHFFNYTMMGNTSHITQSEGRPTVGEQNVGKSGDADFG